LSYYQSLRLAAFVGLIATTAVAQTPEANQKPPPHRTAPAPTAPPPGHQGPPPGTPAPPHPVPGPQGSPPPQFRREEVGRPEPGRAEPGRFEPGRGAGEFRDGPHPHYGYYEYRERHFDRFSFEEQERWRGGYWRQDWHNGRYGWWWWNDGFWYYYPQPIYPYPDYVAEDYYREPQEVIVVQPPDYQPPVYQPAPAQPLPPAAPPPQQYWYYCDDPAGYSPYVTVCNVQWRQVPVITPPNTAPQQ
jgi:hypothetical protein